MTVAPPGLTWVTWGSARTMEGDVNEVWANDAGLPAVANLLLTPGFGPQEASKLMGGNYTRVFKKPTSAK